MDERCRKALQYIAGENIEAPDGGCRIIPDAASEVELLDAYSRAPWSLVAKDFTAFWLVQIVSCQGKNGD